MNNALRIVILVFFVLAGSLLFCGSSEAASPAVGPKASLDVVVSQALDILKQPGYANPATRPPLRMEIETLIDTIFDFSEFSSRTVGARWAGFTADQQRRFDEAFARLLLSTYLNNIEGYKGEKIEYTGEMLSPKGNRAEVSSIVTLADGKKVPVRYRMMDKQGRWVVYDVLIENVSLIKNYRAQFKEILTRGTPDELIARVLEKAAEVSAEKKSGENAS